MLETPAAPPEVVPLEKSKSVRARKLDIEFNSPEEWVVWETVEERCLLDDLVDGVLDGRGVAIGERVQVQCC